MVRDGVLYRHIDGNAAHRRRSGRATATAWGLDACANQIGARQPRRFGGQGCGHRHTRRRPDIAGWRTREPFRSRGRNNMDGSGFGELGRVTVGRPTSVTITLNNPTGTDQTFTVSTTKFTPDTFAGTVPSIWNAGTLSAGIPRSLSRAANGTGQGLNDVDGSRHAPQGPPARAGSISMVRARTTCVSRITPKSFRKHR